MNLLNNKKYYANGQLSLKKILFGFLNEDVSKIGDNPDTQTLIDAIVINVGYIPCYNFNDMGAIPEESAVLLKMKQKYLQWTKDTANQSVLKDPIEYFERAFAYLMLAAQLNEEVSSPDDSLTKDNLAARIVSQLGSSDINQFIRILSSTAENTFKNTINTTVSIEYTPNPSATVKFSNQELGLIEKMCYGILKDKMWGFDDCLVEAPPVEEEPDKPVEAQPEIHSWYRFPQLNGGFFEMADSLLDESKMKAIQNTSRNYKQYEKAGTMYGLIDSDGAADEAGAGSIREFFKGTGWQSFVTSLISGLTSDQLDKIGKIINGYTKRELGRILDEFFKNRMVKVGEYYLIDNAFLLYVCLIAMQQAGIKVQTDCADSYKTIVKDRAPKIVKAKYKPEELPDDVANADEVDKISPQKLTIKQMFQGRADKNLANYNNIKKNNMAQKDEYNSKVQKPGQGEVRPEPFGTGNAFGDDAQSDAEFENYKKNIGRSKREKLYF